MLATRNARRDVPRFTQRDWLGRDTRRSNESSDVGRHGRSQLVCGADRVYIGYALGDRVSTSEYPNGAWLALSAMVGDHVSRSNIWAVLGGRMPVSSNIADEHCVEEYMGVITSTHRADYRVRVLLDMLVDMGVALESRVDIRVGDTWATFVGMCSRLILARGRTPRFTAQYAARVWRYRDMVYIVSMARHRLMVVDNGCTLSRAVYGIAPVIWQIA